MKQKNYFLRFAKLTKTCLVAAGLFVSSSIFSADITTGLILHYDFDAISGTNVPDLSGNNNVGTLQGAAKDTVGGGYSGNGLKLGVKTDYVALPAGLNSTLSSFTYAAWVKLDALKNATRFFDLGIGADATNNFLAFIPSYNGDNGFMCLRYRPATGTAYNILSTAKCPVGTWAHIALTYNWNGTSGTGTIYLNGAAVGSVANLPYNPATDLGATTNNILGVSRWTQDTNGFGGIFDDVRFYNRALASDDILTLNGLAELNTQYSNLSLPKDPINANIELKTVLGTKGVTAKWTSSNKSVLDSLGTVTRPAKYDAPVKLTAVLTQLVGDKSYTMTKEFVVIVEAIIPTPLEVAQWDFDAKTIKEADGVITVTDQKSGFEGTCVNEARIRTIGTTQQYNVLDLGNNKGYFDMGTEIGKAVYSLTNYTMCGFFRIDDTYAYLNSNGNFYWTFSNSADADKDKNGYIIGSLKAQSQSVANYYNVNNQATGANLNATKGGWHHFAYVQNGNTGTTYIDGVQSAQNTAMTNLPALILPKTGMSGTLYNWLGRSNYINDVYLRSTLLYDFRLLSTPLTSDDLNFSVLTVPATIDALNSAYAENPDYILPELDKEMNNLSLGDLSAVKANLTLPSKGTLDNLITISWKTKTPSVIDGNGVVNQPSYYNYNDTLIASLSKSGQKVVKKFPITILAKAGTAFTNDLIVKYDFSNVADTVVTDVAEKHFTGILKNNAKVQSIGKTVKYNVLNLGDSIGYFDMGAEMGKVMYNLTDYTVSAYYRISSAYPTTELAKNGNFLWNFSNSTNILTSATGYLIASLKNQTVTIASTNWTTEQYVTFASAPLQDSWHHMAYTQSGTTGTLYVDGMPVATGNAITNLLTNSLAKAGNVGSLYNWIGRSCYAADAYLRKTLVYDFRVYRKALNDGEVQTSVLDVASTIAKLDAAYNETPSGLSKLSDSQYQIIPSAEGIKIEGLTGTEKVMLFDIAGRQLKTTNNNNSVFTVKAGVYMVRINNSVAKVVVK